MKNECDIVQDLLFSYNDGVLSETSKELVEEHLKKCDKCKEIVYKETVRENMSICPNCGAYFRMHINKRLETILDEGSYKKFDLNIDNVNPLNLDGYEQKIKTLRAKTGIQEAVSAGTGKINGEDVVICVMDSGFLMGSMGSVVGEKITYSMEKAIELGIPFIIFCTSGRNYFFNANGENYCSCCKIE